MNIHQNRRVWLLLLSGIFLLLASCSDDEISAPEADLLMITNLTDGSTIAAPFTIKLNIPAAYRDSVQQVTLIESTAGEDVTHSYLYASPWQWPVDDLRYSDGLRHSFWAVVLRTDGTVETSPSVKVKISRQDDEVPTLISPDSGTSLDSLQPVGLQWRRLDSHNSYECEIAGDDLFTDIVRQIAVNDTTASFTPPRRQWYYWRVRKTSSGTGPWSPPKRFHAGLVFDTRLGPFQGYQGNDLVELADGSFFVVGNNASTGNNEALLSNFSRTGQMVWEQQINPGYYAGLNSLKAVADNAVICAGSGRTHTGLNEQAMLVKCSEDGSIDWTLLYGPETGSVHTRAMGVDRLDGGFIMAGYQLGISSLARAWLGHTNASGDLIWSRNYGGDRRDFLYDVAALDDGFVAVGSTRSFPEYSGYDDGWILRCDAAGDTLWTRIVGRNLHDKLLSVKTLPNGAIITVGSSQRLMSDVMVALFDGQGNLLWERYFGGLDDDSFDADDFGCGVQPTRDGGFLVVGQGAGSLSGDWGMWVLKLNYSGEILWQNWVTPISSQANAVVETETGGCVVTGYRFQGYRGNEFCLTRFDAQGQTRETWPVED